MSGRTFLAVTVFLITCGSALTQLGTVKLTDAKVKTADHVYKKTPQGELTLHGFFPADWQATDKRPVIVFFFGGGWKNGAFTQFVPQSEYFAGRGIVALSADYRIESKHKTTPDVAVEDAKSAVRWVRANAAKLGIDPDKVIAAGGSAGGHLAACTAYGDGFNAAGDPEVSCKPNALVLFNPVMNLSAAPQEMKGAGGADVRQALSPNLFVKKDGPPAVLFFGTADRLMATGTEYVAKAKELGLKAELYTAAGQPHGFFNRSPWIEATTRQADLFLASLGYLTGEPTVKPKGDVTLKKE